MVPSLSVLKQYLNAKKEFLACSSTIKQVCLPVWEAAFFMFELSILVGGFVPLPNPLTSVRHCKLPERQTSRVSYTT